MSAGVMLVNAAPGEARLRYPFDTEALYAAVDRRRRRLRISFRQVCRASGVPTASTLTRLGRGGDISIQNVALLLLWLGDTDLGPYLRGAG